MFINLFLFTCTHANDGVAVEDPYPITPTFVHWVFPHGNLPPPWRSLHIRELSHDEMGDLPRMFRDAVAVRDKGCRMTLSRCGIEAAHLVPSKMDGWFANNGMALCRWDQSSSPIINDLGNLISLRADVHTMLDRKELLMMPKVTGDGSYTLVSHLLRSHSRYLYEQNALWHNRTFQDLSGVVVEFLFARFAWAIFNEVTIPFLDMVPRPITVRVCVPSPAGTEPTVETRWTSNSRGIPPPPFKPTQDKSNKRSRPDDHDDGDNDRDDRCDDDCPMYYSRETGEMLCYLHDDDLDEGSSDTDTSWL